jgi:hypothetical protein
MLKFIKILVDDFLKTALSIPRILLFSRFMVGIPKTSLNEIIILGNGPSFEDDFLKHKKFFKEKETICVNHFPSTEYYVELKPKYYIMAAPDLWLDDIEEKFIEGSNILFQNLAQRTSWDIKFFVPFEAKKYTRWQSHIKSNSNIKIIYFNNIAIEGFSWFRNLLFNINLGMPRPHNIMIPALMISIAMGFKNIYMTGADHSWFSEIKVMESNEVLINQKHFYDKHISKAAPLDKRGLGKRKLHEILHKFMTAFESYFYIEEYSEVKQVKILNLTKNSFIDAFKRISIEKLNENQTNS